MPSPISHSRTRRPYEAEEDQLPLRGEAEVAVLLTLSFPRRCEELHAGTVSGGSDKIRWRTDSACADRSFGCRRLVGHVHEAAVVALEGDRHVRRGAVAVLDEHDVGLAGS